MCEDLWKGEEGLPRSICIGFAVLPLGLGLEGGGVLFKESEGLVEAVAWASCDFSCCSATEGEVRDGSSMEFIPNG